MLLFAMDSSAYKSLDWLGTGVLNSICLEMDKERLILDKDYELIFFQKNLSETRLTKFCLNKFLVVYLVLFKPPSQARCSLTINRLTIKSTVSNFG